jgi:hypothetical protein
MKEMLYSLPVRVDFAGFQSDTLTLGRAGWDLSIKQDFDLGLYREIQLAMRHGTRETALYCLSHPVREVEVYQYLQDPRGYHKFFKDIGFTIAYAANDIHFQMPIRSAASFRSAFRAFDPRPQEREEMENVSIKDFSFFKTAQEEPKELIVDPQTVSELLDKIIKTQGPEMAEIRARENKRRNSTSNAFGTVKPAHNVMAQIITLAS